MGEYYAGSKMCELARIGANWGEKFEFELAQIRANLQCRMGQLAGIRANLQSVCDKELPK